MKYCNQTCKFKKNTLEKYVYVRKIKLPNKIQSMYPYIEYLINSNSRQLTMVSFWRFIMNQKLPRPQHGLKCEPLICNAVTLTH